MWMPRFSGAYKIGSRMVVKAGYGLYYDTLNAADTSPSQAGYNVTTTTANSLDLGRTLADKPQHQRGRSVPCSR